MSIYIVLWILLIGASVLETNIRYIKYGKVKITTREFCFWVIFIFCMLIGIMRNEYLGHDCRNYERYFNTYGNKEFLDIILEFERDNGYYLWNKIIYMLGIDYWGFRAITYAATFSIFSYVIYKESKNISVSFLCYVGLSFFLQDFYILRNTFAYSLCFLAFGFLKANKKVRFILLVLLASTFHKTALFYLLLLLITSDKVKNLSVFKKVVLIVLSMLSGRFLIPIIYQFYRVDYSETAAAGEGGVMLIIYLFMILAMGFYYKKTKDNSIQIEYNTLFTCIYFQVAALFFSLMSRVTKYFALMFTIVVPDFLMKREKKGFYLAAIIAVFSVLYFWILVDSSIVPYRTHWDG